MSSGSQIIGDLVLSAANDPRHGTGALSVASNLNLTSAAGVTQKIISTSADLEVSSGGNLTLFSNNALLVKAEAALGLEAAGGITLKAPTLGLTVAQATLTGSMTISGDLTVSGTTTTVDATNMTVTDNIVQLNKNPTVGRSSGLLLTRHTTDSEASVSAARGSAALLFDEMNDRFRIGYTDATDADGDAVVLKADADLQVQGLVCVEVRATGKLRGSDVCIPGIFDTVTLGLDADSTDAYIIQGLNMFGAYELVVVGPDGGSHGSWRIAKSSSTSSSFLKDGNSIPGTRDEMIAVEWPANSSPTIKHSIARTAAVAGTAEEATNSEVITYRLKYLTA